MNSVNKDGKWVEQDKNKIIDDKNIYYLFKDAHYHYADQQKENLQSAVMVDTENVVELTKSPLYYIQPLNYNDNTINQNNLPANLFGKLGNIGVLLDVYKYYPQYYALENYYCSNKTTPILSIIWQYLQNSTEYAFDPIETKNVLLHRIAQERCLSNEAKNNVKDTVINIKLKEERSLGDYAKIEIDTQRIIFNLIKGKEDKEQEEIYDKFTNMLDIAERGVMEKLINQLESDIYTAILDTYNSNIREKLLTDFETYGYAAYYVKKIKNKHRILNIPCGSFMYNKNYEHQVSFFCYSYFDEKNIYSDDNDIKSYFKIFVYNEEQECYDMFKISHKGKLDQFIEKLKNLNTINKDVTKVEYKYSVKELPITIKVNNITNLYGFPNNAQMFIKAVTGKIAELRLEYLSFEQIKPVVLVDSQIQNDINVENRHTKSVSDYTANRVIIDDNTSVALESRQSDLQGNSSQTDTLRNPNTNVSVNIQDAENNARKEDLMRSVQVSLPNAFNHYNYQYQTKKQELQDVGNGRYLQQMQMYNQAGMTTTNATKSEQTAMIGMSTSFIFFRDLLEKGVNLLWRDNIFSFISMIKEIYNETKNNTKDSKLEISKNEIYKLKKIATVLLGKTNANIENTDQFIITMYIAYVLCFGHYSECPKTLKGLIDLFESADKQIAFTDSVAVTNKTRYTDARFFEDITDFMQMAQVAGMDLTEINKPQMLTDARKTPNGGKWIFAPEVKEKMDKYQAQDSTWNERGSKEMMANAQSKNPAMNEQFSM